MKSRWAHFQLNNALNKLKTHAIHEHKHKQMSCMRIRKKIECNVDVQNNLYNDNYLCELAYRIQLPSLCMLFYCSQFQKVLTNIVGHKG